MSLIELNKIIANLKEQFPHASHDILLQESSKIYQALLAIGLEGVRINSRIGEVKTLQRMQQEAGQSLRERRGKP
ncbi:MAG: hypothetical protein HC769_21815 [Cyanobacteria bacterium CRU_2_1]|nr:hypothetical protein [Cyanobacteria bacterium CRU_2_1]